MERGPRAEDAAHMPDCLRGEAEIRGDGSNETVNDSAENTTSTSGAVLHPCCSWTQNPGEVRIYKL